MPIAEALSVTAAGSAENGLYRLYRRILGLLILLLISLILVRLLLAIRRLIRVSGWNIGPKLWLALRRSIILDRRLRNRAYGRTGLLPLRGNDGGTAINTESGRGNGLLMAIRTNWILWSVSGHSVFPYSIAVRTGSG